MSSCGFPPGSQRQRYLYAHASWRKKIRKNTEGEEEVADEVEEKVVLGYDSKSVLVRSLGVAVQKSHKSIGYSHGYTVGWSICVPKSEITFVSR